MSIYKKLLEVQREIGAIAKDATNPFYKSKYFDINSLLAQIKPVLNKHNLVLTQGLATSVEGKLCLCTRITESDTDQNIDYTCPIPEGIDAQKTGSAITYFRRYALTSLLALEAEDDDAESVSKRDAVTENHVAKNESDYNKEPKFTI